MKAIIMAGGEGSRLRPLTCTKPKPMVKLLDRPVIEYIIALLKKHRITELGITARYLPGEIMEYFGDGSDFGVSITYFVEETPLGTAGSVKSALGFLDDTFLVISGDAMTDIDLSDAVEFHKKNAADATLVLKKVDVPLEYGVVVTDTDGKIIRFIEKPTWGEVVSDMVNTGIYILEPDVFRYGPQDGPFDFSCDLFPKLMHEKKRLYGYNAEGYWCDIGDTFAYMSCQYDMLAGKVDVPFAAKQMSEGIYLGNNVTIDPGAELHAPVYIGDGVRIGEGAVIHESSVLESGAHIGKMANIKKSIVGSCAHVGAFSQLRACVIGEKAKLKPSVSVYEQSVVGDMCMIGENSVIKPSIKLWPNKTVEAGTQVHTNLVWEKVHKKTLFEEGRVCGEINVDVTPESITRLGAAYGALVKSGRIAVSVCGDPSADMLGSALTSGLMSAGCEVYDCGVQLGAMTRFATRFYNLDGGAHICAQKRADGCYIKIDLMDENGCDISAKHQRKLENLFEREDFVRAEGSDVKKTVGVQNYKEFYIRDILKRTTGEPVEKKILVNTLNKTGADIISRICDEIGAEAVVSEEEIDSLQSDKLKKLSERVQEDDFFFGAALDDECEHMVLIDENGRVLDKNSVLALDVVVALQSGAGGDVVLPVSAPQSLTRLAKRHGRQVVYTKIDTPDFMRGVAQNGSEEQFVLNFDGVGALLRILVYLAESGQTLSKLMEEAEQYFLTSDKVYCRAERKGTVIKELMDRFSSYETDFTDGVKVFDDRGWVLVVPDGNAPSMRVISEGMSAEMASELAAEMVDKIKEITER